MRIDEETIFIIGAGFAGRSIAKEIKQKGILGRVVGFIDDDPEKIGTSIEGIPVLGPIADIIRLKKEYGAREALIAIPGATGDQLRRIHADLAKADFTRIRILPGISQLIDGNAHLIQTREIRPQDLLGRDTVSISLKESVKYLRGKRVLVTGAGGSIGNELSRQLLAAGAERLYLFDHDENSVYEIEKELRILQEEGVGEKAVIVPVIGELQDADYVEFILGRLKAEVIFHCAAHKHVPMSEANPVEAVKNNLFGTKHLVKSAQKNNVKRFVLISTDKAVEPNSVYGASKMLAEELVLHAQKEHQAFMVVRFGNVLDSRGSIVPLFKKQILKGGPVTITHPESKRYFMTIPEACALVLKAGGVGENGTLYLLDMGEAIKIYDLACQMIRFYGFKPEKDIQIQFIGLRQGEKLSENLWNPDETPVPTDYEKILRVVRKPRFNGELPGIVANLSSICYFNTASAARYRSRKELKRILHAHISTIPVVENEPEY